jgi:cytochrome c553
MSRLPLALLALAGASLICVNSFATGDPVAGKAKSAVCAACHGVDGNSNNPEWPSLAAQHEDYLVTQLQGFKQGWRQNVLMSSQAIGLSDQDMQDLAAYFSAQPAKVVPVDPKLAKLGRELYFAGDAERGIAACAACHGPAARGNGPAGMPALSGQRAVYTVNQLKAYAAGERKASSDVKTAMMSGVASLLEPDDMVAVAAFVQGLARAPQAN